MGNGLICMPKKDGRDIVGPRSRGSRRRMSAEEELLHRQALSMAIQQHQLSQRFDGSMSRRIGSTSSRRRTLSDPFSNGKQVRLNSFSFFFLAMHAFGCPQIALCFNILFPIDGYKNNGFRSATILLHFCTKINKGFPFIGSGMVVGPIRLAVWIATWGGTRCHFCESHS